MDSTMVSNPKSLVNPVIWIQVIAFSISFWEMSPAFFKLWNMCILWSSLRASLWPGRVVWHGLVHSPYVAVVLLEFLSLRGSGASSESAT